MSNNKQQKIKLQQYMCQHTQKCIKVKGKMGRTAKSDRDQN